MKQTCLQPADQKSLWVSTRVERCDNKVFYRNLIKWGRNLKSFFVFDSAGYRSINFNRFDWLVMAEEYRKITTEEFLARPVGMSGDWIGFLVSYDFTATLHNQKICGYNLIDTEPAYFFEPVYIFYQVEGVVYAEYRAEHEENFKHVLREINSLPDIASDTHVIPNFKPITSKKEYLFTFDKLLKHLYRGDIYEVNYCVFYISESKTDYESLWAERLSATSGPMGGLFKNKDLIITSKSPERFFTLKNGRIYSQPIKGTIQRGRDDQEDELMKRKLRNSRKERSENVMIVDLVRNDLSRICEVGSVVVDELFGIYTFSKVHQMISTISGKPRKNLIMYDVLKALFPMGSMTGAPKISAMNIIRNMETHQRGYYSGTAGYIAPDGEMDSNVIIRSIIADQNTGRAYIGVGSAVTIYTTGEDEFNECVLKLNSILS